MGAASSKIEEDKALLVCRERRRFVRQALDGRYSLADAHLSYIEALRNTGVALGKFFEPDNPIESSLYSSTSATPEPHVLTEKSASQASVTSRSPTQHVEILESHSPIPSSVGPQINMNHMKSMRNTSTTIQEKPSILVKATMHSSDISPKASPRPNGGASAYADSSISSPMHEWDYFEFFHPIDNQFSYGDNRILSHGSENMDDIRYLREADAISQLEMDDVRKLSKSEGVSQLETDDIRFLREAEGIPELEEEGGKSSVNGKSDSGESEDDFDRPSSEPLVRIFKNRTKDMDLDSMGGSSDIIPANNHPERSNEIKESFTPRKCADESDTDHSSMVARVKETASPAPLNGTNEAEKEMGSDTKDAVKDFVSSIKEIQELFCKASDSGRHVPRMLEANRVNSRPLFAEGKVGRSNSKTFSMVFRWCREETYIHEETTTTDIKKSTWYRSGSSISSSSQNFIGIAEESGADRFSGPCMNSGSHASTLDRLYAWEKKLYDEVKVSGIVRKEYDMRCKLLRQQESRCENSKKTDEMRAKVKDLYARVKVAIHRINSISKTIEELRDEELQPQLEELIEGLSHMWAAMLECHTRQVNILLSVACSSSSRSISRETELRPQAAIGLEYALNLLCSSLTSWISAHKSYLRAINEWLHKCAPSPPAGKKKKKKREESSHGRNIGPPIYGTCREWLSGLENLPTGQVTDGARKLAEEMAQLLVPPARREKRRNYSLSRRFGTAIGGDADLVKEETPPPPPPPPPIDAMQSHLHLLVQGLQTFSRESVKMYADLDANIRNGKDQLLRWQQHANAN